MRDFDINTIGKKMPYQAPSEDFFEKFTDDLLAKVTEEQKPKNVFSLRRTLTPVLGVAAAVAVIMTTLFMGEPNDDFLRGEYIISENLDESIDSFLGSLTDEELTYLAAESSYADDFYTNLPTE